MNNFPDFVCIGAQKSGTTWLYHQLHRNDTYIPRKECNILTRETPTELYNEFYEQWIGGSLRGDVSPYYATQPHAARRLARLNPSCRIIFLLRDPAARAFSQYCMATDSSRISPEIPFWDAFVDNLQFMKRRGCYLDVIREYLSAGFQKENLLLLPFELIEVSPSVILSRLAHFLDLPIVIDVEKINLQFAQSTLDRCPPREAYSAVQRWYKKRNAGLSEYLWWNPSWL